MQLCSLYCNYEGKKVHSYILQRFSKERKWWGGFLINFQLIRNSSTTRKLYFLNILRALAMCHALNYFILVKSKKAHFLIDKWNTFLEIQLNKWLCSEFACQGRSYVSLPNFELFKCSRYPKSNEVAILVFKLHFIKPWSVSHCHRNVLTVM